MKTTVSVPDDVFEKVERFARRTRRRRWADLETPRGSKPGFRRAGIVVQGAALTRSKIATERTGKLPGAKFGLILAGVDIVLGR